MYAPCYYCSWNCSSKAGTQKVKDLGIIFFRFPRDKECEVDSSFSSCGLRAHCVHQDMHPAFLFRYFIKFHSVSYLRYFWLCTMNLFFIQQYKVVNTCEFLSEIQNTVISSPITLGKVATVHADS